MSACEEKNHFVKVMRTQECGRNSTDISLLYQKKATLDHMLELNPDDVLFLCPQCVLLADLTTAVLHMVVRGHPSQGGHRLWPRLLRHLPGGLQTVLLSPPQVSAPCLVWVKSRIPCHKACMEQ